MPPKSLPKPHCASTVRPVNLIARAKPHRQFRVQTAAPRVLILGRILVRILADLIRAAHDGLALREALRGAGVGVKVDALLAKDRAVDEGHVVPDLVFIWVGAEFDLRDVVGAWFGDAGDFQRDAGVVGEIVVGNCCCIVQEPVVWSLRETLADKRVPDRSLGADTPHVQDAGDGWTKLSQDAEEEEKNCSVSHVRRLMTELECSQT